MTTNEFILNDIWNRTIKILKDSGRILDTQLPYYESKLIDINDEKLTATVQANAFINFSIMNQNIGFIESCFEEAANKHFSLKIVYESEDKNTINNAVSLSPFISRHLDTKQTFANFVVGKSNIQAQFAAMTCANNPGIVYNPLFIYGNSGLGKTHLLNAMGNLVKQNMPDKKVGIISGSEFVEGVAKAYKQSCLDDFKNAFNELDLLLVDDIQFIAGKDKTHEIFFTVFNNLVNNRKQICITADRTPAEIKGLEDRIISRFNQGLTVNIEAPEYETSLNILKMKISNSSLTNNQTIDDDVLSYIATNFSQDVRSLEGAINRLLFFAIQFSNEDHITLSVARNAFKDVIKESTNELTITSIRRAVCDYYSLTKPQIISATRTKNIATARHIAMYLCRKLLDAPYDTIGAEFGGRDHSTVISSCDKVEKLIKIDPLYLKAINEIEAQIKI